jgi:hypothetical protein
MKIYAVFSNNGAWNYKSLGLVRVLPAKDATDAAALVAESDSRPGWAPTTTGIYTGQANIMRLTSKMELLYKSPIEIELLMVYGAHSNAHPLLPGSTVMYAVVPVELPDVVVPPMKNPNPITAASFHSGELTVKPKTTGVVEFGIDGDEQASEHQNATLDVQGELAITVQTIVKVPEETLARGEEEVAHWLRMTFGSVRTLHPHFTFNAWVGKNEPSDK